MPWAAQEDADPEPCVLIGGARSDFPECVMLWLMLCRPGLTLEGPRRQILAFYTVTLEGHRRQMLAPCDVGAVRGRLRGVVHRGELRGS